MTIFQYPAGVGGVLGDELVTATELYTSGSVFYVHHTGSNSNRGIHRQKPWASLVYALTQVQDTNIIVLLDGHTETVTTKQTIIRNGLKIVAEGQFSGEPTVTISVKVPSDSGFDISGTNVALGNIKFPSSTTAPGLPVVNITGTRSMIRGCRFELDVNQVGLFWDDAARGPRLYNTTFISVSTTTPPLVGVLLNAVADADVEACTFDGGTTGFQDGGIDAGLADRFRAQQLKLLNGADAVFDNDVIGYVGIAEKSGGSSVTGFKRRLPNGFRQTGDAMLADIEFYMSGTPYYVHYATGDDANAGTDELAPKKTLGGALSTVAEECDIIVLLPGHTEPISSALTTPFGGTTIVGCGTSAGNPTCVLYRDVGVGAIVIYDLDQVGYLRNIWFSQTLSATPAARMVTMSADYTEVRGCLFTPGANDTVGLLAEGSFHTIRETLFISPGTTPANRASTGLSFNSAEGSMTDQDVRGCLFANGIAGFSQFAFYEFKAVTRLYVIGMTLSSGADASINASTTGLVNPETASGSALVKW